MKNKELIKDCLWITLSSLLMAVAVNFFFREHTLAPGGITGMSIIVNAVTGLPMEYITLGISGPLLVLGIIFLGKNFGIKTLYITITNPMFLKIIPQFHITNSLVIAAIAGGLLVGIAIGIAVVRGCATGGTDLLAMLINKVIKFLNLPIVLFILDGIVVVASGFISKNFMVSIFSLLSLFIISNSINLIINKFGNTAYASK